MKSCSTRDRMLTKALNKAIIALTKFSLNKHCINLALEKKAEYFLSLLQAYLSTFHIYVDNVDHVPFIFCGSLFI